MFSGIQIRYSRESKEKKRREELLPKDSREWLDRHEPAAAPAVPGAPMPREVRVGDGGASWRRRALKRKAEMSEKEEDQVEVKHPPPSPQGDDRGSVAKFLRSRSPLGKFPIVDRAGARTDANEKPSGSVNEAAEPIEDANMLAARAIKARMDGNDAEADRLDAKAQEALKQNSAATAPQYDSRATAMKRPEKEVGAHSTLRDLIRAEREENAHDFDCQAAILMSRSQNDNAEEDGRWIEETDGRKKKSRSAAPKRRQHNRPKYECRQCTDSSRFVGRDVIAMSPLAYISFPPRCLLPNHLILCPSGHVPSTLQMDDETYDEFRNFQKSLVSYFDGKGLAPIFFELVTHLVSREAELMGGGPHAKVEVFAVPTDRLEESKAYFKKSLLEAESEWATHTKIIETSGKRGAKGYIPKNFPFVHVDFSLGGGFTRVIESGRQYPRKLGIDVVCGILERDSTNEREYQDARSYAKAVSDFRAAFVPFDWTSAGS